MLLTQDARFADDALDLLVDAARRRPEFGVLGPEPLHDVRRGVPFSYGVRIGPAGVRASLVEAPAAEDGIIACDSLDGAFLVMRPKVLGDVGDFDERLFMYYEEADLLRAHGGTDGAWVSSPARVASSRSAARRGPDPTPTCAYATASSSRAARRDRSACSAAWCARYATWSCGGGGRPAPGARARRGAPPSPVVGGLRGLVDVARRRFGPPPPDLPGMGDMRL